MYSVQIAAESDVERMEAQRRKRQQQMIMAHAAATADGEQSAQQPAQIKRDGDKVGRNDPCPCGSGKKYKKCHGRD